MIRIYRLFKVLGSHKRLGIVKLLHRKEKLSVEAIGKKLRFPYKSTSKQLLTFEGIGFVKRTQDRWRGFYSLKKSARENIKKIITIAKTQYRQAED